MRFGVFFACLLAVLVCSVPPAHAQALPNTEQISILLSPAYPRPYDTVKVTLESSLLDLSASSISISVNGTVIGEGERSATFRVGAAGVKSVLVVTTKDTDGTHTETKTITPTDLALVVEPNSSVPAFYKGGRLVASEGPVRIIAIPDFTTSAGARIPPQNLVYSWKFGDRVLNAESGIGKNILTATAPVRYRDATITLTVTSQDKTLAAQATTMVSPVDPFVRIYKNDPLGGVDFSSILSGIFTMPTDEQTFRAVPYYYATFPEIAWTLNGTNSDQDPDLTVRTTGATKGSAIIGARATNANAFTSAESRFTVQFGEARSTGIFGL